MSTGLAAWRETVVTRLWPVPAIAVVAALLLGLAVSTLDARVDDHLSDQATTWLFGGDADAARSLLAAIASSLITVTALTFSLTVVTLQLASSQFSPRLLRTFSRDSVVQYTLALLLATFTYALTVLRSVRGADGGGELVPRIGVTLAFLLAVASVVALVFFLGHLTKQIRVETMLQQVRTDALTTIRSVLPQRGDGSARGQSLPSPQLDGAFDIAASAAGFLTRIDYDRILEVAVEEDVVVRLDEHVGAFVVEGSPLGVGWPASGLVPGSEAERRISAAVVAFVHTGVERTSTHDTGFGLRQLVDVANKALSPGINDPTTAVHALGHISALLCELADRDLRPVLRHDDDGRVRVAVRVPGLSDYIDLGVSQPRRYGAADLQVLERIAQVLLELSRRVSPQERPVLSEQLRRLRSTADEHAFHHLERQAFDAFGRRIEENLGAAIHQ
jgi:uncharacterized membrane protein